MYHNLMVPTIMLKNHTCTLRIKYNLKNNLHSRAKKKSLRILFLPFQGMSAINPCIS